tara:strand:- start:45 stop:221 length:177 start_codon:yes stop_codon:yes gene_type:complete
MATKDIKAMQNKRDKYVEDQQQLMQDIFFGISRFKKVTTKRGKKIKKLIQENRDSAEK